MLLPISANELLGVRRSARRARSQRRFPFLDLGESFMSTTNGSLLVSFSLVKTNSIILGMVKQCREGCLGVGNREDRSDERSCSRRGPVLGGPKCDILVLDVRSVDLYQNVH